MDIKYFISQTGITIREGYFEQAIIPMFEDSGKSPDEFCRNFEESLNGTENHIITIIDAKIKVLTDDFWQLYSLHENNCTLLELLNALDDSYDKEYDY